MYPFSWFAIACILNTYLKGVTIKYVPYLGDIITFNEIPTFYVAVMYLYIFCCMLIVHTWQQCNIISLFQYLIELKIAVETNLRKTQ